MPRIPEQYRNLSRAGQIARWLRHGGNLRFGNLSLLDLDYGKLLGAETYGILFALAEPGERVAHVLYDLPNRSHTSTCHRNRMLDALERQAYQITEVPSAAHIIEIKNSLLSGNPMSALADIEEIDEASLPPPPLPQPVAEQIEELTRTVQPRPIPRRRPVTRARQEHQWWTPGGEAVYIQNNAPAWSIHLTRDEGTVPVAPDSSGSVTRDGLLDLIEALTRSLQSTNVAESDRTAALQLLMRETASNLENPVHIGVDPDYDEDEDDV